MGKVFNFMYKRFGVLLCILFLIMFSSGVLFANQLQTDNLSKTEVVKNVQKLRIPFIANDGQTDERVKFYANTFGGTVFVTKDGEIVYSMPKALGVGRLESRVESSGCRDELRASEMIHSAGYGIQENLEPGIIRQNHAYVVNNSQTHNSKLVNSELQGIALKETLVGAKVKEIKGEESAVTKVNYFKGNDPSKWKSNIATYDMVNLGEVYNGIELKLKAYGNNVEKLFHVKPGADPEQIKISLSGIQPPGDPPPKSHRC
ncbi:MAG: hypothetical protein E3K37_18270 [Candidatus Kuenenia sp.]|nr:hypothetical protein [Candidatus Kuenenia hertensis]